MGIRKNVVTTNNTISSDDTEIRNFTDVTITFNSGDSDVITDKGIYINRHMYIGGIKKIKLLLTLTSSVTGVTFSSGYAYSFGDCNMPVAFYPIDDGSGFLKLGCKLINGKCAGSSFTINGYIEYYKE